VRQSLIGAARAVVVLPEMERDLEKVAWLLVPGKCNASTPNVSDEIAREIQSWCQMPVDSEFEIIQMFPSQEPDAKLRSSWLMPDVSVYSTRSLRRGQFLHEGSSISYRLRMHFINLIKEAYEKAAHHGLIMNCSTRRSENLD
jgi:hypothetical protein